MLPCLHVAFLFPQKEFQYQRKSCGAKEVSQRRKLFDGAGERLMGWIMARIKMQMQRSARPIYPKKTQQKILSAPKIFRNYPFAPATPNDLWKSSTRRVSVLCVPPQPRPQETWAFNFSVFFGFDWNSSSKKICPTSTWITCLIFTNA